MSSSEFYQVSLFDGIPEEIKCKYRYQYFLDKMFFSLSP